MGGRGRANGERRRGREASEERERSDRAGGVIPVPEAFVLEVCVSCACDHAAHRPAVSHNCLSRSIPLRTPPSPSLARSRSVPLLGQLLGLCCRGIVGDNPVWPFIRSAVR